MTDTLEMARKALPSQETLRDRMSYDPDTGLLVWRVHQGSSAIGSLVGYKASGYFWTRVDGRIISLHRIAYIWMTGSCPSEVDHRNGNGLDNRWQNLRPATRSQNMANRAPTKNASGFPGVKREYNRFSASIQVCRKRIHLGMYESAEAAHGAYLAAREKHFGGFNGRLRSLDEKDRGDTK